MFVKTALVPSSEHQGNDCAPKKDYWYVCVSALQRAGRQRGGGQVTETVGPSVVRTQKSSDRFCSIEWSWRERRERTSCFCPCEGGRGLLLHTGPPTSC